MKVSFHHSSIEIHFSYSEWQLLVLTRKTTGKTLEEAIKEKMESLLEEIKNA